MPTSNVSKEALWFQSVCQRNGLSVRNDSLELLEKYVGQLLEWNKKLNLVSRKDEENVWERHILHSTSLLFHISLLPKGRILDLGTGGGLPGIPIKILSPDLSVILIDSVRKKILAVESILRELSLNNVKVECGRAEELAKRKQFQNQFDYVITRGVAKLKELVQWSLPYFRVQKSKLPHSIVDSHKTFLDPPALIAMKGGDLETEVRHASRDKHVSKITVIDLMIQGLDLEVYTERKAVVVHFKRD